MSIKTSGLSRFHIFIISFYRILTLSYHTDMPSLKALLLPTILCLVPIPSFAATTTTSDCPQSWYKNSFKHQTNCCYGHMMIEATDAYCCVYDLTPRTESSSTSTKTATSFEDEWAGADYCFKKIPFTASDYSSQVSLASAQAVATNTGPSSNEATSTSTSSGSSSTTATASVTPTTNAAVSLATAKGVVLGGAGVAAALFAL
jgi:hypothetical protein